MQVSCADESEVQTHTEAAECLRQSSSSITVWIEVIPDAKS